MSDLLTLARTMRPYIERAAQSLPDADGLKVKVLYPRWEKLVKLGSVESEAGYRFTYNGDLYKCIDKTPNSRRTGCQETGLPLCMSALMKLTQGRWQTPSPMTEIWN